MHDDVKRLLQWHDDFVGYYQRIYADLTAMINKVQKGNYTPEQLVDLGYLCREIAKVADDLRKEGEAKQGLIGKVIALHAGTAAVEDPDADTLVRGELASGTPDMKQQAAIPKYGTPEYDALCKFLGLSGEGVSKGVVGFSFTRLADLVTEMAAKGQNPPPGVLKTYPVFTTIFTKKRKSKED